MGIAADGQQKTLDHSNKGWASIPFLFEEVYMDSKNKKKEYIRSLIIDAAKIYKNDFAGKCFMYVHGGEYFEVVFETKQFKHLTGVESSVDANNFYKYAKRDELTCSQFGFSVRHPFKTAKKKLKCFPKLYQLTTDTVCMLKDLETVTITYKIGITNLKFTLGLVNRDDTSNIFIPQTLRINDDTIEKSKDAEFIDFVLVKDGSSGKYTDISYADKSKSFPEHMLCFLSKKLKQKMYDEGYIVHSYELNDLLPTIISNAYVESETLNVDISKNNELLMTKE